MQASNDLRLPQSKSRRYLLNKSIDGSTYNRELKLMVPEGLLGIIDFPVLTGGVGFL